MRHGNSRLTRHYRGELITKEVKVNHEVYDFNTFSSWFAHLSVFHWCHFHYRKVTGDLSGHRRLFLGKSVLSFLPYVDLDSIALDRYKYHSLYWGVFVDIFFF